MNKNSYYLLLIDFWKTHIKLYFDVKIKHYCCYNIARRGSKSKKSPDYFHLGGKKNVPFEFFFVLNVLTKTLSFRKRLTKKIKQTQNIQYSKY